MGRKRQDREPSADLPPICQRVDWLLKHNWNNNITGMARDLGVSQTAVARVLGGQLPSGKMLEGFAVQGVNLRWLLTGQGQESVGLGSAAGGVFWPLVSHLLPGKPADCPELLTHLTLPAATPFVLEAAYWLQVNGEMPIASAPALGVRPGDYLLIETADRWTRRPEAYLGRIVALRLPEQRGVILAKCDPHDAYYERIPQHELDTFGVRPESRLFPGITRADAGDHPPGSKTKRKELTQFYASDIVGVVLQRTTFLDR